MKHNLTIGSSGLVLPRVDKIDRDYLNIRKEDSNPNERLIVRAPPQIKTPEA